MPVLKCPNGKFRIGTGPCVFISKEKAERAYAAYRAKKHMSENEEVLDNGLFEVLGGKGSGNKGHSGGRGGPGNPGGSTPTKGGKKKAKGKGGGSWADATGPKKKQAARRKKESSVKTKAREEKLVEVVKSYKEKYILKAETKRTWDQKALKLNKEIGAYEGMRRAFVQRATPLRGKAFRSTIGACVNFQNLANTAALQRDRLLGRVV
jgi:ribosomal protein S13